MADADPSGEPGSAAFRPRLAAFRRSTPGRTVLPCVDRCVSPRFSAWASLRLDASVSPRDDKARSIRFLSE
ncbi:MAG TPA: hypothetical protein DD670_12715 [Planctomycetaceae bacterium]|nr:hypothetical protein [Planctomycetaceae bacterium]